MTSSSLSSSSGSFSVPPLTGSQPQQPPRRRRGLLDALLMIVLVYTAYARTPLGAVVETAVNVARGQKDRPSWLATFKGRETDTKMSDAIVADVTQASAKLPPQIEAAAAAHDVDAEALAALITVHGQCTPQVCDLQTPPRAGNAAPKLNGKPRLTVDEAAEALAGAKRQLGPRGPRSSELYVETLFVGAVPIKLALEQAERSSIADAADVEKHADFLSPSTRRGPLQGALATLSVYRLRTLAWPADKRFRITSPFGERIHPVTGQRSFHNGTDIGVPTGTPLLAAHHASVKRQSRDSVSGDYVILSYGLGLEAVYCHMSDPQVHEGELVARQASIGLSGSTGRVTGPHLHYILRIHDKAVDAEKYGESPTRDRAVLEAPPPPPPPDKPAKPDKPANGNGKANGKPKANAKASDVDAGPAPPPKLDAKLEDALGKIKLDDVDAGSSP